MFTKYQMLLSGEFRKQPRPKKLASVVKPKTRRALGIAVVIGGQKERGRRQSKYSMTFKSLSIYLINLI